MPEVWVSNGEFIDKWTILEIKSEMINAKLQNSKIKIELDLLSPHFKEVTSKFDIETLISQLSSTNLEIWRLMDLIYAIKDPTQEYAKLSMKITYLNQKRAFIKREIDLITGSITNEEKSYFSDSSQLLDQKS